ncbi:MAG: invasion associated locus B family protein [Pseudomonadota bacterium]
MKAFAKLVLVSTLAGALTAGAASAATKLTTKYRDWEVYQHKGTPADICFATSKPKETAPRGISRDSAYFYVSAWPKDGVKAEVSLKLGFEIATDSDVVVQIGNGRFTLFPKGDKAFVRDPRDELKLIEAMKNGSFMVVTAKSEAGTSTKDTYSLIGVTKAINAIDNCT